MVNGGSANECHFTATQQRCELREQRFGTRAEEKSIAAAYKEKQEGAKTDHCNEKV
ncbi:MAG: hypothetical protein GY861_25560, partial [bacterium]|nr:hypothetical protein [bacterium]